MTNITVEVVYALTKKQYIRRVVIERGATVELAIRSSGLLELCTDIDLTQNKVGIYGQLVKLTDLINDGDRIEIYRSLITDPKLFRQRRHIKKV